MKLTEYQTKERLKNFGISIPKGVVATSVNAARDGAAEIGHHVLLKPQLSSGDVVIHASDSEENTNRLIHTLFHPHSDMTIRTILIEEKIEAQIKLDVDFSIDTARNSISLTMSVKPEAGLSPSNIHVVRIHPTIGLREYQIRDIMNELTLSRSHWHTLTKALQSTYRCFRACYATNLRVDPLAVTPMGRAIALDATMTIDDNAVSRLPDVQLLRTTTSRSDLDDLAHRTNLHYIHLNGQIAFIANGAGLGMASIDTCLQMSNGMAQAASFIDIGSMPRQNTIDAALSISLREPEAQVVFLNVFGGVVSCEQVAMNIVDSYQGRPPARPIIIRLAGPGSIDALNHIESNHIENVSTTTSLTEACQRIIDYLLL